MKKWPKQILDNLYNFVVQNFLFELIYCCKIWFKIYLCLVMKNTRQISSLPSVKTSTRQINSLPSVAKSNRQKVFCRVSKKYSQQRNVAKKCCWVFFTLDRELLCRGPEKTLSKSLILGKVSDSESDSNGKYENCAYQVTHDTCGEALTWHGISPFVWANPVLDNFTPVDKVQGPIFMVF